MAGSYWRPPTQWDVSPAPTPGGADPPARPDAPPAAPPTPPADAPPALTPPGPTSPPAPATPSPPDSVPKADPPEPVASVVPFCAVDGAVTMMMSCTASATASGA